MVRTALLVEDNAGDVFLVKESVRKANWPVELDVATDGQQALDYLEGNPPYEDRELPELIILDLNLRRVNGHELLLKFKAREDWALIPVIVLTTSDNPKDIRMAYRRGANAYLIKGTDFAGNLDLFERIKSFWLEVACLPKPALRTNEIV